MKLKSDRKFVASALVVLGVAARLIPHPANVSPMTAISLFGGAHLNRKAAFAITFSVLIASDILLSLIKGYPAFGMWSLFTYTGFAAMVFAGSFLQNRLTAVRTLGFLLGSSVGFWLWTNFGLWLTGDHGMYPRTLEGLMACYAMALPFLQNSLAGDLVWGMVFFLGFQGVKQVAPRFGYSVQGA